MSGGLYYLQDCRSYVGNDMLWWRVGGNGYTTDLRKAATFTEADAMHRNQSRETDIPWPVDYINARVRPTVDMQECKRFEALAGSGIKLANPPTQAKQGESHE